MAELSLKQIIDKLNSEFTGESRKLVFWYDDNADFVEDIQTVALDNASLYLLQQDNQFRTKLFLEREDTTTNYLIYAPFPKPDVKDNHLEDTLLYSKRFYADRASLLTVDLGIAERFKPIIEKHIKFFASKDRTQRFYDLEIESFNENTILTGLLCAACKSRICSFEEVVRIILTDDSLEDNKYLAEFQKYNLTGTFWKFCQQQFGYTDSTPSLERLLITLFVTYADRYISADLPTSWRSFVSIKSGNVIAFMDNLMNSVLYRDKYDALSQQVAGILNATAGLSALPPEDLLECDNFRVVDTILLKWLVNRLLAEDTGAMLNGLTIPAICEKRSKMHFGQGFESRYKLIQNAYQLVLASNYRCPDGFVNIISAYQTKDYAIDQAYRKFYCYYDGLEDTADYEKLRDLVENIYTNEYLAELLPKWNVGIFDPGYLEELPLQREFYNKTVYHTKIAERTVVIFSDALRYEVGQELFRRLQDDPKSTVKLETMLSVLPSYTRFGMAAMLPHTHNGLVMTDDYKVLVDGVLCNDLAGRQTVLQKYVPESACVQFDTIKNAKQAELRSVFTGKKLVYVYHNQIDARGDEIKTENEVFIACEEAIQEILDLIRRISTSANTYRFIVTADHGFIYKRDKLTESDKIGGINQKQAFINRRFIVAQQPIVDDGIAHKTIGEILDTDDRKVVSFPVSGNVFKVTGGGQNYVHGGSSPQEMLIPVIDVKMEKGHMDTAPAQIALVSIVNKITNLITAMDFIQSEPISDTVKAATYRLSFTAADGTRISNENILVADSRDDSSAKRITRLRFSFKNQQYEKDKQYYLVATDDSNGVEAWRHPVIMDLAFADDFDFGF